MSSHFNYCPLVCFLQARLVSLECQKNQERGLRFVLKDAVSDYKSVLSKSAVNLFRISSRKNMAVELHKI